MQRQRILQKPYLRYSLITLAAILGIALCGAGVYAGILYYKASAAIKEMAAPAVSSAVSPGTGQPAGTQKDNPGDGITRPVTFLLTAVDNRNNGDNSSMNTDVMMLAALDPKTHAATIVSLPRDLQMKTKDIPPHKLNYYFPYFFYKDKDSAIPKMKAFMNEMFQFPVDYMVIIDFQGFREMVDEVGGVEVDVDMDMRYVDEEDGTNIDLTKGFQKLDGKHALDFVRYRKSNRGTEESSDMARNVRQQAVLNQLLDKMTSLGGIAKWGGILGIAGKSVKTDIPESRIRDWIMSYRKIKPQSIEFLHIDGEWLSPYIVPKEADLVRAVDALRSRIGLPVIGDIGGKSPELASRVGVLESYGSDGEANGQATLSPADEKQTATPEASSGTTPRLAATPEASAGTTPRLAATSEASPGTAPSPAASPEASPGTAPGVTPGQEPGGGTGQTPAATPVPAGGPADSKSPAATGEPD
jgi:LCP family protein required for cell wall assembly